MNAPGKAPLMRTLRGTSHIALGWHSHRKQCKQRLLQLCGATALLVRGALWDHKGVRPGLGGPGITRAMSVQDISQEPL